jgi:hypothetical protein
LYTKPAEFLGDEERDNREENFGAMLVSDLSGPKGTLGPGWEVLLVCEPGAGADYFEWAAKRMSRMAKLPTAVVIAVNLTFLNARRTNGVLVPNDGPIGFRERLRFVYSYLAFNIRSWLELWIPPDLEYAPKVSSQELLEAKSRLRTHQMYGDGFLFNIKAFATLERVGTSLRARGVHVIYFVEPLPLAVISRDAPVGTVEALEKGERRAVARLNDADFQVLDFHSALSSGFFEPPTTHLDAPARRKIADSLSLGLERVLR